MSSTRSPVVTVACSALRDRAWTQGRRAIAEECAVAFVVDGGAEAVMMATPGDLKDFAYGFALTEGLIETIEDVGNLEIVEVELGLEVRLWLREGARSAHAARRRRRAGPVGCGLCGIESLEQAMRPFAPVTASLSIRAAEILAAMSRLAPMQTLNNATRAVHAAGFYAPGEGITLVREDVGRHNALDKLAGALALQGRDASAGVVLVTSRVSIEIVQKTARIGAPVLAAVSAPTALALRAAEGAGVCVCAIVRDNGLEVFTRPDRIIRDAA